jgi:hypothetical protein
MGAHESNSLRELRVLRHLAGRPSELNATYPETDVAIIAARFGFSSLGCFAAFMTSFSENFRRPLLPEQDISHRRPRVVMNIALRDGAKVENLPSNVELPQQQNDASHRCTA